MTAVGSLKVHYTASRGYHVSAKCDADGVCLCVFSLFPIALFLRITRARARERVLFIGAYAPSIFFCNAQNNKILLL
jgi:hypothetical protein